MDEIAPERTEKNWLPETADRAAPANVSTVSRSISGRSRLIKLNIVLAITFFLWMLFLFLHQNGSVSLNHRDIWWEIVKHLPEMFGGCLLLGCISFFFYRLDQPKSLSFNDNVVRISRHFRNGRIAERTVPWTEIVHIRLGPRLCFPWQDKHMLEIISTDAYGYNSIKLEELKASVSIGNFLNAAKTYAPYAIASLELPVEPRAESSQSYTQLWLQYFSTPSKRERITDLTEGLILGEGQYRVVGRIGGGGQGTAYLALTNQDDKEIEVVLKEYVMPMHKGTAILEQTLNKLKKETELLQALNHPNIVKCLTCFVEDHRGYIVLEYVDGRSLKDTVQLQGPLTQSQTIEIALQCCDILEYLHTWTPPVVHRDITPDNILMQETGQVKLVDFNVAHQLETTATATVVGKHAYIPPEQFRGKPVPASDIYALGGSLFFILTGQEPEPISVSNPQRIRPEIDHSLNNIVAKCTQPNADRRYSSVAELRRDLLQIKQASL